MDDLKFQAQKQLGSNQPFKVLGHHHTRTEALAGVRSDVARCYKSADVDEFMNHFPNSCGVNDLAKASGARALANVDQIAYRVVNRDQYPYVWISQ